MRARSIKPGICDNELLGTADPFCTLLFERLWMMADREGRLEDRPLRIKAQAFPYREGMDIEALLEWLSANLFIQRYTATDGQRYIQVIKFSEHQKPHQNEKPSVIPVSTEPPRKNVSTTKVASEHNQGSKHLALTPSSLTPDSGLLTPHSPSLRSGSVELKLDGGPVERVFEHWRQTHGHLGARLDPKRKRRIVEALKGYTADQLCDAVSGYRHSPHHMGTDPKGQGVKYDDIELFLRGTVNIERGLQLFANPPRAPPRSENATERILRALNGNDHSRTIEHEPEREFPALTR